MTAMRTPSWLAGGLLASLALLASACTEKNPGYCQDAGREAGFACSALAHDAAAEPVADARDGAADSQPMDVPPEVKPPCALDTDCAADPGGPACNTSVAPHKCVTCTEAKHCSAMPGKLACDVAVHQCVACVANTDCGEAGKSVCDVAVHQCVQCTPTDATTCTGTTPVCDATQKLCRSCRADAECKTPGICADYDGHCASADQVIVLKGGTCIAGPGLYCKAADAVAALSASHPILVVRGPEAVGALDPPLLAPDTMLVLGQMGGNIGAGSGDPAGIHISGAHHLWIRDLQVSGGTVGVIAESGADLHVTRCLLTANDKGGLKTIDSPFDITNTIIAKNGVGTDTGGVVWSGVRLGALPTGKTSRFENNTVVDNMQIGVSCNTPYDLATDIVHGNLGGETANCGAATCCGAGAPDPKLDTAFHLQSGSPCIDKLSSPPATVTVDIQGQPRPTAPGKLDCGADEFM